MATRLIGTDSDDPWLPDVVKAHAVQAKIADAAGYFDSTDVEGALAELQGNLDALVISGGGIATASTSETIAGSNDVKAVTPAGYAGALPVVDVRRYGATGDGSTDDTAAIQAALTALPAGRTLVFVGSFKLSAAVTLTGKTDVTLDFTNATVTQTVALTRSLIINGGTRVQVIGGRWVGLGSDYVNTSSVYSASGIEVQGVATDVTVRDANLYNHAGAGVRTHDTATVNGFWVTDCRIAGPGPARITPGTDQFGGSIVIGNNCTNWAVTNCDLSGHTQGLLVSNTVRARVVNNHIHDVTGQHGIYCSSLVDAVIADNLIRATGLQGIKIQESSGRPDSLDVTITGNTITGVGSHGIIVTRTTGTTEASRRITIVGNTIRGTTADDGINLLNVFNGIVADNIVTNTARAGITASTCGDLTITGNRVTTAQRQGIQVSASTGVMVRNNRIIDPAQDDNASTEWGIGVDGASTDIDVRGNIVTDAGGHMKYGLYINATAATMTITDNYTTGATDYGLRIAAAGPIREFARNDLNGTIGRVLNRPTDGIGNPGRHQFAAAAPTTGTYAVGDIVWNTAPAAAGTVGWVCTTAGTPGTWKTFGTIAA